MQRHTLTAKEITDILYQKPDRITAGILNNLSFLQRFEMALASPRTKFDYAPRSWEDYRFPLKSKLRLAFDQYASDTEFTTQKNSFLNARKELKALGMSHRQIGFIFDRTDTMRIEMVQIFVRLSNLKGHFLEDDRAFLGILYQQKTTSGELQTPFAFYERYTDCADRLYETYLSHFEEEIRQFPQAFTYNKSVHHIPNLK